VKQSRRSILHVDLDPFFVSVERALDPALRGRAVVVGGDGGGNGFVAAVSEEARQAGVRVGLPLMQARHLCPQAAFRRGDLAAYGRISDEVTAVLLAASRRVERPSADEAFVDLTPDAPSSPPPVRAVETIRDELQRRLGLDASLGLASSRLAARIASSWARPRGLLVVLPGYELSFLAGRPISALELTPPLQTALERAGFCTLGQLAEADEKALEALAGAAAPRLRAAARGEHEPPVDSAAPPAFIQEESAIRDARTDALVLGQVADSVARRAARRLKPFRLSAGALTVEARSFGRSGRSASEPLLPALADEDTIAARVRAVAAPLLEPAEAIRSIVVRLSRLQPAGLQARLFSSDRSDLASIGPRRSAR
jgi:DNA polymerase-4